MQVSPFFIYILLVEVVIFWRHKGSLQTFFSQIVKGEISQPGMVHYFASSVNST